ncbi:unnamed protein product [Lactuca saligna]|uniref:Uncharacterized protein n=1 Tax=Lactuca saligna TaxID=75948 RepID=A0AA36EPB9_LACSI|nr:unnamed protein product [Lactuca saligna]
MTEKEKRENEGIAVLILSLNLCNYASHLRSAIQPKTPSSIFQFLDLTTSIFRIYIHLQAVTLAIIDLPRSQINCWRYYRWYTCSGGRLSLSNCCLSEWCLFLGHTTIFISRHNLSQPSSSFLPHLNFITSIFLLPSLLIFLLLPYVLASSSL